MKMLTHNIYQFLKLPLFLFAILTGLFVQAQETETSKTSAGIYNDGLALLKEKNYEQGLNLMEEALVLAGEDGNQEVIELAKTNGAIASYNLGKAKLKAKAYDEASTYFERGMELDMTYASNFTGKARVLDQKKMYEPAINAYFDAALVATEAGDKKRVTDAHKRAKAIVTKLYKAKYYTEVIDRGNQYLAKKSNSSVSYYVGKSLMETNNYADAVNHFDAAIDGTTEGKDKMFYAKAMSLEKLGRNAEALETYKLITDEKYKAHADHKVSTLK